MPLASTETCFLWGPRQTGKSTLLKSLFPNARCYDLLLSDEYSRLITTPQLIREECEAQNLRRKTQKDPIIIDEIQKVPMLLDEVHWLIENRGIRFILCGSSARKLKRGHSNLLGGRAVRYELFPLTSQEIPSFSIKRALNTGLIPRHYLSPNPRDLIRSYVGEYLKEEIAAEALARNIPAFSRFLEISAISNGEMVQYQNIASECGVSAPTVKTYFEILEDTLLGKYLPAFQKRAKRRLIQAPKFYLFDVGVTGFLARRGPVELGSELFGKAFEHFIFMELLAHSSYSGLYYPITYWRTTSQIEIDFILGDREVVLEVKATRQVKDHHLSALRTFKQEHPSRRILIVSFDPYPRKTEDGIEIFPWKLFLNHLWKGDLLF